MKAIYNNRYNDEIIFELSEDKSFITMSGEISHMRVGTDEHNNTIMVDPSGGPYIGIGYNMGLFSENFKDMKVNKIEVTKDDVKLYIT